MFTPAVEAVGVVPETRLLLQKVRLNSIVCKLHAELLVIEVTSPVGFGRVGGGAHTAFAVQPDCLYYIITSKSRFKRRLGA
jgi:hypothetical protein